MSKWNSCLLFNEKIIYLLQKKCSKDKEMFVMNLKWEKIEKWIYRESGSQSFSSLLASIRSWTSRWIHGRPTSRYLLQSCRSIQWLHHGLIRPSSIGSSSSLSSIRACYRRVQGGWRRNECSMGWLLLGWRYASGIRRRGFLGCSIQRYIPCGFSISLPLSSRRIQLKPLEKRTSKKFNFTSFFF